MSVLSQAPAPPLTAATSVRYQVLGALCVATVIAYIDRGCIAVAESAIARDLDLSKEAMGDVMGAFFLTYAIFQIPAGTLGHRWGSRRALPFFATAWSAFTGVAALAMGVPGLLVSRLGMGAAEAGIFPAATSTIAGWFPSTRRAWACGVLGSFMGVGGALGAALTGLLLGWLDWRWMFLLYAVPGVAWSVWFACWFRNRPAEHRTVNSAELDLIREGAALPKEESAAVEPTPWAAILCSPSMWWVNGQQFFRAAGYVFYLSWFPAYLMETRGVSVAEAGILTSLPHWAQLFGSLFGGLATDWVLTRTGSRRLSRQVIPLVSLAVCTALIVLSYWVNNAWLAVLVISLGAVSASLAGPSAYAITIDMGGKHVAAVFSTMNMAGNLGGIVFPMVVPRLVKAGGSWDVALFTFAAVHLAAAVCWLFVNPHTVIGQRANHDSAKGES